MRNNLLLGTIVVALATMACGQETEPPGGDGGTEGSVDGGEPPDAGGGVDGGETPDGGEVPRFESREAACEAIAEKWADCGADPSGIAQTCIDDGTMTDEWTNDCAGCTVDIACDQLQFLGCYSACRPPRADVVFRGTGLGAWAGRTVNIEVTDPSGQPLTDVGIPATVRENGTFRIELLEGFPEGIPAQVRFWADLDGDAACGSELDRHAIVDVPVLLDGTEVVLTTELTDAPSVCSGFKWVTGNLVIRATELDGAPDGATVMVNLLSTFDGNEYPASGIRTTVADGGFTAEFPSALPRDADFVVRWFVDADVSNTCDATDLGGASSFHSGTGTMTLDVTPDVGAPTCSIFTGWGYTLSFGATGFDAANGHVVQAFLVDRSTGHQLARTGAFVNEGAFTLEFIDSVPGGYDVELVYVADVDDSSTCEQPADLVGRVQVGSISADATQVLPAASTDDTETCSQLNALLAP